MNWDRSPTPFSVLESNRGCSLDRVLEGLLVVTAASTGASESLRLYCFAIPNVVGFEVTMYLHVPLPPLCFHSRYDLIAKTHSTILADLPPWDHIKHKNTFCVKCK